MTAPTRGKPLAETKGPPVVKGSEGKGSEVKGSEGEGSEGRGSRLHIAELIATLDVGGAERQVVTLSRGLVERGHTVTVVALTRSGSLASELEAAGVEVRVVGKTRKLDTSAYARLRRLLREVAPDVAHTHLFTAGLYGRLAARALAIPVVHTEHGFRTDQTPLKRALDAWLARGTFAITAPTKALARTVAGWLIAPGRMRVIPNAVALGPDPAFVPWFGGPERSLVGRRVGAGMGRAGESFVGEGQAAEATGDWCERFRVVTVGRLARSKDLPTLLRGVTLAAARGLPVELSVVGDGPERAALERIAGAAARSVAGGGLRVRFTGALGPAGVRRELDRAHVFATASRTEGQSVAVLEALARGRPVLATRIPGAAEAVADEVGLLVPVGDANAFARALRELASSPQRWRERSAAARGLARRRFAAGAVAARYEALLLAAASTAGASNAIR